MLTGGTETERSDGKKPCLDYLSLMKVFQGTERQTTSWEKGIESASRFFLIDHRVTQELADAKGVLSSIRFHLIQTSFATRAGWMNIPADTPVDTAGWTWLKATGNPGKVFQFVFHFNECFEF